VLVKNFNISGITNVDADMEVMLSA